MIWLAWRQIRGQALTTGALVAVLLAGLLATWSPLADLARTTGLTGCAAQACTQAGAAFTAQVQNEAAWTLYFVTSVTLLVLPAGVGVFWGAPMVAREMESGTFRLAFSQSVGRGRWLLTKLLLGGSAVALGAGLLGLVATGWAAPIDTAQAGRMSPVIFAARGVVPIAYALIAFVLGVTAGLLLRRTVAAMVLTLFAIVALQIAMPFVVRPELVARSTVVSALDTEHITSFSTRLTTGVVTVVGGTGSAPAGAWILENRTLNPDGTEFTGPSDLSQCAQGYGGTPDKCDRWLARKNLQQRIVYVPATRFWALQWRELGFLLLLTSAFAGLALWRIRR